MSGSNKFKPPAPLKPNQKSAIKRPNVEPKTPTLARAQKGALQAISEEDEIDSPQAAVTVRICPDPFVKSDLVFGLNHDNFKEFMGNQDVGFVLFYDPTDSVSHWCKPRMAKAAEITNRENHVYAAVNCIENPILCYCQSAINLPAYILYSRGRKVKKIRQTSDVTSEDIKTYVEKAPSSSGMVVRRPLCSLRIG